MMESYDPYPEEEPEEESTAAYRWVSALIFCIVLWAGAILAEVTELGIAYLIHVDVPGWTLYANILCFGVYGIVYRLTLLYNS